MKGQKRTPILCGNPVIQQRINDELQRKHRKAIDESAPVIGMESSHIGVNLIDRGIPHCRVSLCERGLHHVFSKSTIDYLTTDY